MTEFQSFTGWPDVDVVIPVRNDAAGLPAAVASMSEQDYPGQLRIYIGLGPSDDDSAGVAARLAAESEYTHVVENPAGVTPAGLNRAIEAGSAPLVAISSARTTFSPTYLRDAVRALDDTGAVNVGGVKLTEGRTSFQMAVAAAMTSPFGMGDAKYHYGGAAGPSDSAVLGVMRRGAVEAVGLFDEKLVRNQDYELNWRLREAGGEVWFEPGMTVTYAPRAKLSGLARQYFQWGRWKREVVRMHPKSLRWRQAVPPISTVVLAASLPLSVLWTPAVLIPAGYAGLLLLASAVQIRSAGIHAVWLPLVYFTMHQCWGLGFLIGPPRRASVRS